MQSGHYLMPTTNKKKNSRQISFLLPATPTDDYAGGEYEPISPSRTYSDTTARKALSTQPMGVRGGLLADIELVEQANIRGIIFPWNAYYQVWWYLTVLGAICTAFLAPYQVAFEETPGMLKQTADLMENVLTIIFSVDILINFNLAFYKDEHILFERKEIAEDYLSSMFWIDLVGVIPFERVALVFAKSFGTSKRTLLILSILRFLRFVRLHRMKKFSDDLRYNARVNLITFTLLRNFGVVVISCHCQACTMYFLARLQNFDEYTWMGPVHDRETDYERYITALYMAITTFCTVGYGDFAPVNLNEKLIGSFFMLLNIVLGAWIIGSITMLMLTGDEKTRLYRESLETLHLYGRMHHFDPALMNRLKQQLRLEFNNREISDDQVLKYFPSAVRRKILRRLYKEYLVNTQIMRGVRPQFVDAFLASCTVEIFSPGEEIVEKGSIQSDLFLLVGGIAENVTSHTRLSSFSSLDNLELGEHLKNHTSPSKIEAGVFIGEIGFFTESPQIESVMSVTVCKTLTMSKSAYKLLASEHAGSTGKILQNLLAKVQSTSLKAELPTALEDLQAGSIHRYNLFNNDDEGYMSTVNEGYQSTVDSDSSSETSKAAFRLRNDSLTAVKDLVTMHMRKVHDDETTRLLFAASRGDTKTISLMCDHGFNPDSADYDQRTALMVASMKGNVEVVGLLLQYHASPNKTDMHGSTALLEAVKNANEEVMELLFEYRAELCLPESQAASILCQAVFDGDILLLKRLLKAGINVNARDYDKRTAAHVAAAEGNVAAIRVLAEKGADLTLPDRWGNIVRDEARRSNARQLIQFLEGHRRSETVLI